MKEYMQKIKSLLAINLVLAGLLTTDIARAKQACPSQNFNTFLTAFQNTLTVQEQFSSNPLTWSAFADSYESPTVSSIEHAALKWPIMPSKEQQLSQKLTQKISKRSNTVREVLIALPDSDAFIFKYSFHKANGCWQLKRVDDLSLNH
jgi:hypothetical protein